LKNRRLRNVLLNAGLLLVSLVFASLLVEFGARWSFFGSLAAPNPVDEAKLVQIHPTRGWTPVPNSRARLQRWEYNALVELNSKGLRDSEHVYEPEPGVFRIVLLGDSYMEACQVQRTESLPHLLEEFLGDRRVEVINLGVNGYSPAQYYLYLKEEGLKYKPDLVLMAVFTRNDVFDCSRQLAELLWGAEERRATARPYAHWDESGTGPLFTSPDMEEETRKLEEARAALAAEAGWGNPLNHSVAYTAFRNARYRNRIRKGGRGLPAFDPNIYLGVYLEQFDPETFPAHNLTIGDYEKAWAEAYTTAEKLIVATRDLACGAGAEFAMFSIPSKIEIEEHWQDRAKKQYPRLRFDLEKPCRWLAELSKAHDVAYLDLSEAFREHEAAELRQLYYEVGDNHWNAVGHALGARAVADYLVRDDLVAGDR
jgi:lysophospholipase L1-like esterase